MDSITQIALGAAVGEAILGKHVGNRAVLWGGICGLFPDLDILIPLGDAVKQFTYHRGPSHSLFLLAALTPFFVYAILKLYPQTAKLRIRWYALVYLAFATHVLLDCLTVYGTQIFWPLSTPPIMWSTIFIIDPVYSVPLFCGVIAVLILSRQSSRGHVINTVCLTLSTIYLMLGAGAKLYVNQIAHDSLKQQDIDYQKLVTIPAPFNTLLWRVLVMADNGYYEGFYSLLDESKKFQVKYYPSNERLLQDIADHWPVKRLRWFTHGFYSVQQLLDDIVITDLRMGLEPSYVFRFKVGEVGNPHVKPTKSKQLLMQRSWDQLRWMWQRIWTAEPPKIRQTL
ncbi:MAG: metal-dependent hydrolase [Desulfobacterales bacterium]